MIIIILPLFLYIPFPARGDLENIFSRDRNQNIFLISTSISLIIFPYSIEGGNEMGMYYVYELAFPDHTFKYGATNYPKEKLWNPHLKTLYMLERRFPINSKFIFFVHKIFCLRITIKT